jgi:hypothetical protein
MVKGLAIAAVSAIFLLPFTYPRSAHSLDALTYQQAVQLCYMGYPRGCQVMNAYRAPARGPSGSPADRWVSPGETQRVRPGPLTTYDFIR